MQKITTFLTFNSQAEEAANLYVAVFKDAKITSINRNGETVFSVTFQLFGQNFYALNGGPHFNFSPGISLFVDCETQQEVDELWEKLSEGGEKGRCGWLKDKFGVSWQIIPSDLSKLMQDKNPEKSKRVMQAMMQMNKIVIADLQKAYDG
ncbi:VOC family protein [uncultured Mucilaginibacter sp.]|uniref:VOC family protein n=1 Tax=uncultured Mucilaginibacter sp. TaxID=797541 RepID=UPI0026399300|nr:VOC family protein [uncultured Mucilaginibacter sp.]